jgi:hypothetical protein
MSRLGEVAPGQARGKGVALPTCCGSAVGNRRLHGTRASGMGGHGPVRAYRGNVLWHGSPAGIVSQVAGGRYPLDRIGQGREREKGWDSN